MELDPRKAGPGNPGDFVQNCALVNTPRRVHDRDRHEPLIRGVRAFQDVLIVDDTREPDEAGPGDTGAVELPHESRVARVVLAVYPSAVSRDVHERVETCHGYARGMAAALPMLVFPASRFTAKSSIHRPANAVQRSGASGSIGST